jgi:hypothetical protein
VTRNLNFSAFIRKTAAFNRRWKIHLTVNIHFFKLFFFVGLNSRVMIDTCKYWFHSHAGLIYFYHKPEIRRKLINNTNE